MSTKTLDKGSSVQYVATYIFYIIAWIGVSLKEIDVDCKPKAKVFLADAITFEVEFLWHLENTEKETMVKEAVLTVEVELIADTGSSSRGSKEPLFHTYIFVHPWKQVGAISAECGQPLFEAAIFEVPGRHEFQSPKVEILRHIIVIEADLEVILDRQYSCEKTTSIGSKRLWGKTLTTILGWFVIFINEYPSPQLHRWLLS